MSDWTPERQTRYERAIKAGTLGWRCLLCNQELRSTSCPHSLYENSRAVEDCRIVALTKEATR